MRETHLANPYHRVGWWNGRFHQKGWLRDVGVAIFLCEASDPESGRHCPCAPAAGLPPGFDDLDPEGYSDGPCHSGDPYLGDLGDPDYSAGQDGSEADDVLASLANFPPDPGEVEQSATQIADESDDGDDGPREAIDESNGYRRLRGKYPRQDARRLRVMLVGDVTHIHGIGVQFCCCPGARPRDEQLLEYGIYPASQQRPSTGFTLHTLDYLRLDEVECKTAPEAYSRKLRRLTDSHDWRRVPVCPSHST